MSRKGNGQAVREQLLSELPKPDDHAEKLKEAAALVQADKDARSQQFLAELQALCQKYRCDLKPMFNVIAQ